MKALIVLVFVAIIWAPHGLPSFAEGSEAPQARWEIGGTGGAYLQVLPGELEVEIRKRDLDARRRGRELQVTLFGPDRQVLDEAVIPAGGGMQDDPSSKLQRAVLRARIERPGICALMIHVVNDRYGLNVAWGMRTNAAAYVIETARGHRDERHQEPIVLLDEGRPADICFTPRADSFEIEVEGLSAGSEPLVLFDENDTPVARIPVNQEKRTAIRQYLRMPVGEEVEGSVKRVIPADSDRGERPWRLHFPEGRAFVNIDGVTRWQRGDRYEDQCVWTPDADSWFPFLEHRWLISPYQRTAWGAPGSEGRVTFRVHNNASEPRSFHLSLEFPGETWSATLSDDRVNLNARETREVSVSFATPKEGLERICRVSATPKAYPVMTTWTTLSVRGGKAPATEPLDLPLALAPYDHENEQFGYLPRYPVDNQVYFDLMNRPCVVTSHEFHRRVGDAWKTTRVGEAVVKRVPEFEADGWSVVTTKIAFDANNDVYLLGRSGDHVALLHSTDGGETFVAYLIAGREDEPRAWDFEQFSGHNVPLGPPPVVRLTRTSRSSESGLRWRSLNDLELIVGEKAADGGIEFREPMLLSHAALKFSMHSGIPSSIASRGSKVHAVWGEATDPEASREEIPGVPAYVATFDRESGELTEPVFMSHGPPPNDGHNTPSITVDHRGYLHVVVGTHGRPFQYLRSLAPNDAHAGWTEPTRTSDDDLRQTYVGLVCDAGGGLHLVFRLWRSGPPHPAGATWAALAYQHKPPGKGWEEPKVLVTAALSEYSIYYHRLTVDRQGTPFLSYDYWSTMWFYRNDQRGNVSAGSGRPGRGWGRTMLTAPDGGETWKLW